jgi:sugar (pentulose or hexulose) kinase
MPHIMGIDISTTSAKSIIIDQTGAVVGSGTTPQSVNQPHPL